MARFVTTVDKTGPFFTHDPALTFRQNADRMMGAIASEAERDVDAQVASLSRTPSTEFLPGVVGRTVRLDGAPFKQPGAVVSQTHVYPWKSAGQRQYRGGKFGGPIFRRTRSRVGAVRKLNQAELLKGLNP